MNSLFKKEPLFVFLLCFMFQLVFQIKFIRFATSLFVRTFVSVFKNMRSVTQDSFQHLLFTADVLWFHNFIFLELCFDQGSHCSLLEKYGIFILWVGQWGLVFLCMCSYLLWRKTSIDSSNKSPYYNHQGI